MEEVDTKLYTFNAVEAYEAEFVFFLFHIIRLFFLIIYPPFPCLMALLYSNESARPAIVDSRLKIIDQIAHI